MSTQFDTFKPKEKMKLTVLLTMLSSTASALALDVETYSDSLDFAQVTNVVANQKANGRWCFNTSVLHNDQSWEHYADGWEVLDLDGNRLAFRKLAHPHDNEQPFTRSLCDIEIANEITEVIVRAKCNTHGYGGKPLRIELYKDRDA